ncbi:uncharacterized protein LAJ45_04623 [Morchella importuna]|uniref:uncharacterized protein n=1 Tax=Morchella importuna TaxID=1174673 RepID=UPI001E8E17EF|nr:uncharacterized protein LAJ45_04623 [Morchella importuna]KAH8151418.1 hypothetical protein LAJ45_04623 [Morchella importuna]
MEDHRCKWGKYGCKFSIKLPCPDGTDLVGHQASCEYKCNGIVDRTCQIVSEFQESNGQTIPNIGKILNPGCIHKMKPVETLATGLTLRFMPPRPVIFKGQQCWKNGPPPPGDFLEALLNAQDHILIQRVPSDAEFVTVARQLIFGDHLVQNVQSIHNIHASTPPSGTTQIEYTMVIPPQLGKVCSAVHSYTFLDATPKYSFTDLRVEGGLPIMALHEGTIRNLWMLWPPTESNEKVFYRPRKSTDDLNDEQPGPIFRRIAPALTNGRMVIVKPGETIFVPAGWIFATLTLEGGYLPKLLLVTKENLNTTISCLRHRVNAGYPLVEVERSVNDILDYINPILNIKTSKAVKEVVRVWEELNKIIDIAAVEHEYVWSSDLKHRCARIYKERVLHYLSQLSA